MNDTICFTLVLATPLVLMAIAAGTFLFWESLTDWVLERAGEVAKKKVWFREVKEGSVFLFPGYGITVRDSEGNSRFIHRPVGGTACIVVLEVSELEAYCKFADRPHLRFHVSKWALSRREFSGAVSMFWAYAVPVALWKTLRGA